ncbi:hypothetical protein EQV77_00895 [Halobacillus fulvus]|nr:hypothetical protein EQV77_00895 [Halobacillus fulvus]
MPYKVIRGFRDKNTQFQYRKGSEYPGASVSEARLEELLSSNNAVKQPVIEKVEVGNPKQEEGSTEQTTGDALDSEFPKHSGGPYYELSNGEKVKGKEAAEQAEKELT